MTSRAHEFTVKYKKRSVPLLGFPNEKILGSMYECSPIPGMLVFVEDSWLGLDYYTVVIHTPKENAFSGYLNGTSGHKIINVDDLLQAKLVIHEYIKKWQENYPKE